MTDRRREMLGELLTSMRRLHRRRRAQRHVLAMSCLLVAAGGLWMIGLQHTPVLERPSPRGMGAATVVIVTKRTGRIRNIDDGELLRRLSEIDRPAGLIRTADGARLTNAVTDARLDGAS